MHITGESVYLPLVPLLTILTMYIRIVPHVRYTLPGSAASAHIEMMVLCRNNEAIVRENEMIEIHTCPVTKYIRTYVRWSCSHLCWPTAASGKVIPRAMQGLYCK